MSPDPHDGRSSRGPDGQRGPRNDRASADRSFFSRTRRGEGPGGHPRLLGREDPDDRRRGGHVGLSEDVRQFRGRRPRGARDRRGAAAAVRHPPLPGVCVLVPGLCDRDHRHRRFRFPASRCPYPLCGDDRCCGRSILAAIFWLWQRSEGTLSIHSITTQRREAFYWATVFATFALGTALGDFTATSLNLGYLDSGILFAIVILIPALARWRLGLNSIAAFWMSYVVTRPLGASFADYISKPQSTEWDQLRRRPDRDRVRGRRLRPGLYLALARPDIQKETAATSPARNGRARPDDGGRSSGRAGREGDLGVDGEVLVDVEELAGGDSRQPGSSSMRSLATTTTGRSAASSERTQVPRLGVVVEGAAPSPPPAGRSSRKRVLVSG